MKKLLILCTITLFAPGALWAENPKALLVYYDDKSEIELFDFTGKEISSFYMGYPLLIGFGIRTGASTAELKMEPNGTIIKLQENSFLKIEEMQGTKNGRSNRFAVVKGFLRIVASRLFNANYSVKTPSTVLGVRGTDFSVEVIPDTGSSILVQEGKVEIFNPASGEKLLLQPGEGADVRERITEKIEMEMAEVRREIESFRFRALAPDSVPREVPEDYDIEFDYFSDIEYDEFRKFFADENYFDDSEKYLEQFRDYYRREMADFRERFEEEQESFEAYRYKQLEEYYRFRRSW